MIRAVRIKSSWCRAAATGGTAPVPLGYHTQRQRGGGTTSPGSEVLRATESTSGATLVLPGRGRFRNGALTSLRMRAPLASPSSNNIAKKAQARWRFLLGKPAQPEVPEQRQGLGPWQAEERKRLPEGMEICFLGLFLLKGLILSWG